MPRFIILISLAAWGALATGCATREIVKPAAQTTLVVTRAGDRVQMQWQSARGATYTVIYSTALGSGARWQPLPQASRLKGTGELMQVEDRPPPGRPRYYDIQVEYGR